MIPGNRNDRIRFIIQLLNELNSVQHELNSMDDSIKKESEAVYQRLLAQCKRQMEDEMNQYRENIAKISSLNNEITREINSWYAFANDPANRSSALFPFNYLSRKKKLQRNIKKSNELISDLMIRNRFLKEKLKNHELELKEKSLMEIEQCSAYKNYTQLMNTKNKLIKLLKTLIPQIEGLCPVEADISNLAPLLARLETALLDNTGNAS